MSQRYVSRTAIPTATVVHASFAIVFFVHLAAIFIGSHTPLGDGVRWYFSGWCHQLSGRSYHWGGEVLSVCARCVGVWAGFFAASLLAVIGHGQRRWWSFSWAGVCLLVLGGSWLLGYFLLPETWHGERTVAGFVGGVGVYVLLDLSVRRLRRSVWYMWKQCR